MRCCTSKPAQTSESRHRATASTTTIAVRIRHPLFVRGLLSLNGNLIQCVHYGCFHAHGVAQRHQAARVGRPRAGIFTATRWHNTATGSPRVSRRTLGNAVKTRNGTLKGCDRTDVALSSPMDAARMGDSCGRRARDGIPCFVKPPWGFRRRDATPTQGGAPPRCGVADVWAVECHTVGVKRVTLDEPTQMSERCVPYHRFPMLVVFWCAGARRNHRRLWRV